ncbi:16S rRNA (cytosine(1402)-N(4))-methyltransferase RsmH [Burkholderiales bacterium]|nr:16S rRNA (cytosine(1402)-N(4))-methyltransferase RsmH [Burkholderiales bacterium]
MRSNDKNNLDDAVDGPIDSHTPVLLYEAVDALNIKPDGVYIDGTYGRGGHAKEVLKRLSSRGLLVAIDKDPQAVCAGKRLESANFKMFHGTFGDVKTILKKIGVCGVDGVLLDLGVSSPQLDSAARGFSFSHDGPLDMRMDTDSGSTAEAWLNCVTQTELARVLKVYGEERFAPRIAKSIVTARTGERISTTRQLRELVEKAIPRKFHAAKNPATKTFQAIRIHLNRELEDLEALLSQVASILLDGARLVIISFHSLEDRIVKRFIVRESRSNVPDRLPIRQKDLPKTLFKSIGKATRPTAAEIERNPRSRSAILRVAQRSIQ